ncbi:ribosomal RNA processing protein 1 homolog [Anopheles bellator]|uniref:ribosomal RNA processing protein 1 homolog n=1 Tax=Anopheles bellator TaxID=139047 RepID=UPI0026480705|nr:ribosomal RNA processing protein 1 homolog [Anopheles bellator]
MVIKEDTCIAMETTDTVDHDADETSGKAQIIAQEIKFARVLAGNDPKLRRKVLKNLETWLTTRSQSTFAFSDADFLRLWKGLFYCMWMSDKPLVQEELAESLGSLVNCFKHDVPIALQFFKAFLITMGIEWYGIDRWRIDKFMMLVRRVTRRMLFVVHENGWQTEHVGLFVKILEATILNSEASPFGLSNHFNDMLLEEVAKVSEGEVPTAVVTQLVDPYVRYMFQCTDQTISGAIAKNIFNALLHQSDLGLAYEEKFDLWKRTNFVENHIDKVQFDVEYEYEDEEEEGDRQDENGTETNGKETKVYDPRAGRVNVDIPQIEFDAPEILALFEKYRYKSFCTKIGKKSAAIVEKQFKKYADGIFPLGVHRMPNVNAKKYAIDIDQQMEDIEHFREELYGERTPKTWKEKKRARRLEKKLANQKHLANGQQEANRSEQGDGTDGMDIAENVAEKPSSPQKAEAKVLKKKKTRKLSPAELKKQKKLEVLKHKKQEKLKLLKERLKNNRDAPKQTKTAHPINENEANQTKATEKAAGVVKPTSEPTDQVLIAKSPTIKHKKSKTLEQSVVKKSEKRPFQTADDWTEPVTESSEEVRFAPSRTLQKLTKKALSAPTTPAASTAGVSKKPSLKRMPSTAPSTPATARDEPMTPARKRVKIALSKNVAQELVEHVRQVKSSPQLPFDSAKKPMKSLLKPNLIPSPVNPFYKKKLALK